MMRARLGIPTATMLVVALVGAATLWLLASPAVAAAPPDAALSLVSTAPAASAVTADANRTAVVDA